MVNTNDRPLWSNDPDYVNSRAKYGNNLNTNQFWNYDKFGEPYSPQVHNGFDNPRFLWPPKEYTDISGNNHVVQRGYMRSLITAPSATIDTPGIQNRRLFFQFNPELLVRSVQQSVGTMNPLLQDPAQLLQPVPGTASFGFQLFFNREHEVAAGYDDPDYEAMKLPDGSGSALTSKVGVLADIMVLDSIIGQGISEDMLQYVQKFQRNQLINQNNQIIDDKDELRKTGQEEEANQLTTLDPDEQINKLTTSFNANIGNSAFLNPLPFRVLFSSLFMVEGVATSVEVMFQKFSRAMVPTQCKVTINMYALYFGFAKKDTLLTTSLAEAAVQRVEDAASASESTTILDNGIKQVGYYGFKFRRLGGGGLLEPAFKLDVDRTDAFKDQIKSKVFTDLMVEVTMDYKVSTVNNLSIKQSDLTSSVVFHDKNKSSQIPLEKASDDGVDLLCDQLQEELNNYILNSPSIDYISYRLRMKLFGKNKDGLSIECSKEFSSEIISNFEFADPLNPQKTLIWTSPFPDGYRPGGL